MKAQSSHVVIQTAFLGDLFLAMPVFRRIKESNPHDKLILICKRGLGDYFLQEKIVDRVIEVIKGDSSSYQNVISELGSETIVNLFCIHRSLRSQLLSLKIKAQRKVGFNSILGRFIFDDLVKFQKSWPDALRQLNILTATDGRVATGLQQSDWALLNSANDAGLLPAVPIVFQNFSENVELTSRRIAVFPGSVWNTKRWTKQGYAKTIKHFSEAGYEVNLMGGLEETILCEEIKTAAGCGLVQAGKKSIAESVAFIKTCNLVICNDSAPTHMAASLNIPVVSIFGPTTLALGFRPWSSNAIIVQNTTLACRPCGKHGHKTCPVGHHHCMTEIDAKTVIEACTKLLKPFNP